ncbi:MAG: heterodisulfide reductase-related iron-sulfur binding cluster [Lachnospiraceae bacterium]|nr:heterodisulfide reductase-related iron-sulfur binding cluster [Lachnospiraceae bacterium]
MAYIKERGSTHVYHVNRMSKEDMDQMLGLCVHEQPAYCVAACPFKVDTKAMLALAAKGDFKKALALYEKVTPFPLLLCNGCEAPCEQACKLCELGDGISVREVERAIVRYGERTKRSGVFRMRKKKTAVIFGSGLFALFLAGELEKKMYPATVYCEEQDYRDYVAAAAPMLPADDCDREADRLKSMDLNFEFSCVLTKEFMQEKAAAADLVCASEETAAVLSPEEQADPEIMLREKSGVISGCAAGVMEAAFAAKRAALTADRLAQNLSPRAARSPETGTDTSLYTNLAGIEGSCRVPCKEAGYTKEETVREAKRCIGCHCEECMKSCVYLQEYKKHPGLLAREIYNNTQIIMGDHQMNRPMNSCSLCGQCTFTCPNGFDMGHVCRAARENMVSTDKMPMAPHEFALLDMLFSNSEAFLSRKQPGCQECRYVFFPGCQASAIAPAVIEAAYKDLCQRVDGGVALMLGCCGAISAWAGQTEMTAQVNEQLDQELGKLGNPVIIAGCPSCMKQLRSRPEREVIGIWEILERIGLPESAKGMRMPVAVHDSCGARGDREVQESIRRILTQIGCSVQETELSGDLSPCCGYGGLTSYANKELAKKMAEQCLERSEAPYVTYCMSCRDRFAREGHVSRHILELLYAVQASEVPDISEKRYNRLKLKQELLKYIWNEETMIEKKEYTVTYTDEAVQMMDARMILKSDAEQVLEDFHHSGEAVLDGKTGELIARSRLGNVTFWVRFTKTETGYLVHRAYSHRMSITKRVGQ